MLYITGDCHGDRARFEGIETLFGCKDSLLVAGDFGYLFTGSKQEQEYLDYLCENLSYKLLFIDGNHENFDLLESFPMEEFCGGKAHVIRRTLEGEPKIIHLMRGQVFDIEGRKVFTFGGAYSVDRASKGAFWWPQELPSEEELQEGFRNLGKVDWKVDYVVSHTAPEDTMKQLIPGYSLMHPERRLNTYLELIREKLQENGGYRQWYFGHHHEDRTLFRNQTMVSLCIRNMETNEIVEV